MFEPFARPIPIAVNGPAMTRFAPGLVLAALFASAAAPALAAPGVTVQNAAARMVVIPEARNDVRIDVQRGPDGRIPTPVVRQEGDRLVVDGGLRGRVGGCGTFGVDWRVFNGGREGEPNPHVQRVMVRGIGPLTLDRLPLITAHVPLHAAVAVGDAVFGRVGPSESLVLASNGCGDWTVGDVGGALEIAAHGSGDIHAGRAGVLHAALAGSGDLTTGDVAGDAALAVHGSADTKLGRVGHGLSVDLSGSGDVTAAEVDGPVMSHQSGSGDVEIRGGRSPSVSVSTSGSGDFAYKGEAGAVSAQSSGSGDISVAHALGPVSKASSGSGDIHVGR